MSHHRLIIIGSGPAGLTAAIYAARAQLSPLVFEGIEAGGQLMLTTEVENYPGFEEGIIGPELMETMRAQAERFGCEMVMSDVTRVDLTSSPKKVWVGDKLHTADAVVLSTGATARMIGIEGESRLLGHGVSTCATCDGFFFSGKRVVVVGGGDSSMEEALFLTKFASEVVIMHRSDQYRASQIMLDRARAHEKIKFADHVRVVEVLGESNVEELVIEDTRTGERCEHETDALFVAIGHIPATKLFVGQVDLDAAGYVVTGGTRCRAECNEPIGRLCCGRSPGQALPAGNHQRRVWVHGRH